jgi:hypothetical protein
MVLRLGVLAAVMAGCSTMMPVPREICGNGLDDDLNGKADCLDPDCAGQTGCIVNTDAGFFGTCMKCGQPCTAQPACIAEGFSNDHPLAQCVDGRCAQLSRPTFFNVRVNIPSSVSAQTSALVRVVERRAADGGVATCTDVKSTAAAAAMANTLEQSGRFNLAGWTSSTVAPSSPFALLNLSRTAETSSYLLYTELWTGGRDAVSKFPVGQRLLVNCIEMTPLPLVEPVGCDGGVLCYQSFTVDDLRMP